MRNSPISHAKRTCWLPCICCAIARRHRWTRGEVADVLKCEGAGGRTLLYAFNRQTGLLERYGTRGGKRGPFVISYENYHTADGVQLPHQWVIQVGGGEIRYTVDSIRTNDFLDDGVFKRPVR